MEETDGAAIKTRRACPLRRQAHSLESILVLLGSGNSRFQYIGCLRAFGSLHDFKLDVFTFFQGFKPVTLQCGIVDEDVLSTVKTDESKPFPIVEPLHCSLCLHNTPPFLMAMGNKSPSHETAVETRLGDKSRTWRVESTGTCTSVASLPGPIMWRKTALHLP